MQRPMNGHGGNTMKSSIYTDGAERGYLDGQILIAMPGLESGMFTRTVVYICAHSDAGAMGFIINREQSLSFPDILLHLNLVEEDNLITLPKLARNLPVQCGGPVETARGFVLHSDDYSCGSSLPVSDDVSMSTTLDVLRAISSGVGPKRATMMLGYSGWGPGQLESEVVENGWLTCPAYEELIFGDSLTNKYNRALQLMGVDPVMLSSEFGHA
jgi:putative transcriptional regulator